MNEVVNIKELNARIEQESIFVDTLRKEIARVIVGQQHLVDTLLIGLLSDGSMAKPAPWTCTSATSARSWATTST